MWKLVVFLLIVFFLAATGINLVVDKLPEQKAFAAGQVPNPLPHGEYDGVAFLTGIWKGKEFNSSEATGFNLMRENAKVVKRYPFKMYVDNDLQDTTKKVLRMDYDVPQNPFWLRFIRDEIVEVEDDKLIGKVYLNIVPNVPFALTFFHLEK